jgi:hypothetical protein
MLTIQIIDETIGSLADILKGFTTSFWGLALFIFLATVYGFGQYFILGMIKAKNKEQQIKRTQFNILEKVVTVVQYILTASMVFLVFQMIFASQYYTIVLNIGMIISGRLGIYLMGLFAYSFLSWFRRSRSIILLLFGLAMAVTSISIVGVDYPINIT